jgi:hypothetical protein
VGRPSDSDAKRTKRMSVIIGVERTHVEPKPSRGKATTKKCRADLKGVVRQRRRSESYKKNWCDVMLCYLYFDSRV